MQQGRLAVKQERVNSQEGTPAHPPFLPWVPTALKSLVFSGRGSGRAWGLQWRRAAHTVCGWGPTASCRLRVCHAIVASILPSSDCARGGLPAGHWHQRCAGWWKSRRRRRKYETSFVWRGHWQARRLGRPVHPCPEKSRSWPQTGVQRISRRRGCGWDTDAQELASHPRQSPGSQFPHFTKL